METEKRSFRKSDLKASKANFIKVTPLRDHVIHQNDVHIELKKGEPCEVPIRFEQTLKSEGLIK